MFKSTVLSFIWLSAGSDPPGYVCINGTDIIGASCDIGRYGSCGGSNPCDLKKLALLCDGMHGEKECNGFNSNGYMKRCVRKSCGAKIKGSHVVSCTRTDVPDAQPVPAGCATSTTTSTSSTTTTTTPWECSGQRPPFDLPTSPVPELDDWHNPSEEPMEADSLVTPRVISVAKNGSATLQDPQTGFVASTSVGSSFEKWLVVAVSSKEAAVVLEYAFERWAAMAILSEGQLKPRALLRKPVGHLQSLQQPLYRLNETDADWYCKQDIDTHDWLGRIAAEMSDGEPTFNAASSVFAPNIDDAIFGNPEELNKWVLTGEGRLKSQDFPRSGRSGGFDHLQLRDYMPAACPQSGSHAGWPNTKAGLVGRHLRVAEVGFWDPNSRCGAAIMAVRPPATAKDAVSAALLRITTLQGKVWNVTYLHVRANQTTSEPLGIEKGEPDEFYGAILSQASRWDSFVAFGASPAIPAADRRYQDMPNALMTAYLNTFRGMTPEYGMGKFANMYNEYLPLDTLSLHEGLLEWGHHDLSRTYLTHFFGTDVYINGTTGKIIYSVFGCDGDADYGRLISLYVKAARYSGNKQWASSLLPIIEKMAEVVLESRQESMDLYNASSVLYGLAKGSPEHDLCGGKSYFFNVNVWHIRGLSDLGAFLQETSLSHNKTLEAQLSPAAQQWRAKLQEAAEFTAVRRKDGSVFFLHPCVGADCSKTPVLKPGGSEASCVQEGTCWEAMAEWPGTKQNQLPNYANFRFFSETLLASALDQDYEEAIMDFRDTHRGTLTGMTRFRDNLDDMPILGYGWGLLSHDKVGLFHTLLAGHSANYLSRGTHWGTEQRVQQQHGGVLNERWTNNCGDGGEDCSLCMVSSMPPAMWIRWMLVQEHRDLPYVHLARGAPKRWYTQTEAFGITDAPTRFGVVSYSLRVLDGKVLGTVAVGGHPGGETPRDVMYTVRLISPNWAQGEIVSQVKITAGDAKLVDLYRENSTAVFSMGPSASLFNFTATFSASGHGAALLV